MVQQRRRQPWNSRALHLFVVLATAAVTASALSVPAAADVSTVNGGAFGYFANVALSGGLPSSRGPTPSVTLPPGGSAVSIVDVDLTGLIDYSPALLLQTGSLTVSTQGTTGPTGSVVSSADVQNVGAAPFSATAVSSTCNASELGRSASTTITNGLVVTSQGDPNVPGDETTVPVPGTPAPNTLVNGTIESIGDTFTIVFNELTFLEDDSITVNAVHLFLNGPTALGEVIIGQSRCGVIPVEVTTTTSDPTSTNLNLNVNVDLDLDHDDRAHHHDDGAHHHDDRAHHHDDRAHHHDDRAHHHDDRAHHHDDRAHHHDDRAHHHDDRAHHHDDRAHHHDDGAHHHDDRAHHHDHGAHDHDDRAHHHDHGAHDHDDRAHDHDHGAHDHDDGAHHHDDAAHDDHDGTDDDHDGANDHDAAHDHHHDSAHDHHHDHAAHDDHDCDSDHDYDRASDAPDPLAEGIALWHPPLAGQPAGDRIHLPVRHVPDRVRPIGVAPARPR